MKTSRSLMLALCLLILPGALPAFSDDTPPPSNTRYASCVLKVQTDPEHLVFPQDEGQRDFTLRAILSPVFYGAAREFTDDPETIDRIVNQGLSVNVLQYLNPTNLQIELVVVLEHSELASLPPVARELLDTVLQNLRRSLTESFSQHLETIEQQVSSLTRQTQATEKQLNTLRQTMLDISGGRNLSPEWMQDQITDLSRMVEETEFELQVLLRTMEEYARQLEEARARTQEQMSSDQITGELRQKINLLETQLQWIKRKQESGTVSQQEVMDVEKNLIDSRIELARHQQELRKAAEGEAFRPIQERITKAAIDQAELKLKKEYLLKQVQELRQLMARATEYDTSRIKAEVLQNSLFDSLNALEKLQTQISLLMPPAVIIVSQ